MTSLAHKNGDVFVPRAMTIFKMRPLTIERKGG